MLTFLHQLRDRGQPIPGYQFAFKRPLWAEAEQQRKAVDEARIAMAKMALRLEGMAKLEAELANLKSALEKQRADRGAADLKATLSLTSEATPKAKATPARSADQKG